MTTFLLCMEFANDNIIVVAVVADDNISVVADDNIAQGVQLQVSTCLSGGGEC